MSWLREEFSARADGERDSVLMLSHIPMVLGAFEHAEIDTLEELLLPAADQIYANLAGHMHGNLFFQEDGWEIYVTDATWDDDDTVRLVEVSSDGSERRYQHELVIVPWE